MCGIRRTEITQQHIADATIFANLVLSELSNANPLQWALEIVPIALAANLNTYSLPNRTIAIGSAYISTTSGGTTTDRVLSPMSATEYSAIPNKAQQGFPNSYWFNLTIPTPTIHLYLTPDTLYTYTLNLVTFRQLQDYTVSGSQTFDLPYRFLPTFVTMLAARLAIVYPDPNRTSLAKDLAALAADQLASAQRQDQENVNIYVIPGFTGYFR